MGDANKQYQTKNLLFGFESIRIDSWKQIKKNNAGMNMGPNIVSLPHNSKLFSPTDRSTIRFENTQKIKDAEMVVNVKFNLPLGLCTITSAPNNMFKTKTKIANACVIHMSPIIDKKKKKNTPPFVS